MATITRSGFCCEQSAPLIQFGIGLHIGQLVYGNVGAPDRLEFTVTGSAVNRVTTLAERERDYIDYVLGRNEHSRTKAAKVHGIDRVSLWRKLKKHGLEEEKYGEGKRQVDIVPTAPSLLFAEQIVHQCGSLSDLIYLDSKQLNLTGFWGEIYYLCPKKRPGFEYR